MRKGKLVSVMIAALLGGTVAAADAGVTSAALSIVDSFLVACPAGDLVFHSVMIQGDGTPQNQEDPTSLELCGCPGVRFAGPLPGDGYELVNGCRPTTNLVMPDALADFALRAGGTCSGAAIVLLSGGVLIRIFEALASPDQDGDLLVSMEDRALLIAKIAGPYDPTADLNGDDVLGPADLAVLDAHMGHAPAMPTAMRRVPWGTIKALYYR